MTNVEFGVTYDPGALKIRLPKPKFSESLYWQDVEEEGNIVGQQIPICEEMWEITTVGFQGSDGPGETLLHQEGGKNAQIPGEQEDVFFILGTGSMYRWDGLDCILSVNTDTLFKPVMTTDEVIRAKYTLAVASYRPEWLGAGEKELEHLVLNVEVDGRTIPIEPIVTPAEHYHATQLTEQSLYFVVKRKRVHN